MRVPGPAELARLARTVRSLHPVQLAARPVQLVLARVLQDVPSFGAPSVRANWPAASEPLVRFQEGEARRAAARLARLPEGSLLQRFESSYGFELAGNPGAADSGARARWAERVAVHPYPASVRARRIASAIRRGGTGLGPELARACRAVALQVELHLLGNHLLENGFGLACGGAAATGPEAELWWALGSAIVDSQLGRQFLPDGGHFERSATYHLWLLSALLETIELAQSAGREVPDSWRDVAARALGWAVAVRAPDGTYPLFNDAMLDGSASIEAVLGLSEACGIAIEPEAEAPDRLWARELADTGWLLMGFGRESFMALDFGPDGAAEQPGHAHADHLGFELWLHGRRVCVDYGVSSYVAGPERELCRATAVHNTVELEGKNSAETWSAFRVGRRSSGRLVSFSRRDDLLEAVVTHDGYEWLPSRPVHVRTVRLGRNRLRIEDRVAGRVQSAVSRIRLDEESQLALQLSCQPVQFTRRADRWFPELGSARPAAVYEASFAPEHPRCEWTLEWPGRR